MKLLILFFAFYSQSLYAQSNDSYFQASYEVPTQDPQLKPYATFSLIDFKIKEKNGITTISYELPKELVGEEIKIQFEKNQSSIKNSALLPNIEYSGSNGTLTCSTNPNTSVQSCKAVYKNLEISAYKVESFIRSMNISDGEKILRLKVAEKFSGEPVGIITATYVKQ